MKNIIRGVSLIHRKGNFSKHEYHIENIYGLDIGTFIKFYSISFVFITASLYIGIHNTAQEAHHKIYHKTLSNYPTLL